MKEFFARKRGLFYFLAALMCFLMLLFSIYIATSKATSVASDATPNKDTWKSLKSRLIKDGFTSSYIENLFSHPDLVFNQRSLSAKARELHKTRFPQPEKAQLLEDLRKSYRAYELESSINKACSYLKSYDDVLTATEKQYDVPKEIIVAILLVESKLEKNIGGNSAFVSLASLASYSKFSDVETYLVNKLREGDVEFIDEALCKRANWAYEELKALLRYAHSSNIDPVTIKGSFYGAIGICQFMPSNIPLYGVDGNKDGVIDLFDRADAFASIANYLSKHGWKTNAARSERQQAIFRYNHSTPYAESVLSISERLKECAQ